MKKDVMLTIKSIQKIEADEETIELQTCGKFYNRNKSYWISYDESETTGFAGHKTTLHIENNKVTMIRTGTSSSNLIIEKGLRHQCAYNTGYGIVNIGITGINIKSDLDDNGGDVKFSYSMDFDSALASEQFVSVNVKEDRVMKN